MSDKNLGGIAWLIGVNLPNPMPYGDRCTPSWEIVDHLQSNVGSLNFACFLIACSLGVQPVGEFGSFSTWFQYDFNMRRESIAEPPSSDYLQILKKYLYFAMENRLLRGPDASITR